ncbi:MULTISPECIES: hypothetical protein [Haloferax]|uniref:Uncharacterized protein n=1 Tax=Haloferax massiliensis TaxID=1476858 RepID=A0A0D6JL71_9EURY|nr:MULTISPECIES: hypothetical protein [Haloferax]MDS0242746.1 hypothetical protein [Haloferax sp. S2CR25]MDS0445867.1 hypothetical protein [Haloferax sp. S2CR25-2]CQR48662.1 hypothetical protein BN996_00109 [Haloferax massiliensis]
MNWLRHRDSTVLDRVRNPAYTGDNRCLPCTGVNAVFAVALAGVVAWVGSPLLGAVALAASAAAIGLRGYLIPGTPTLTQRYLPSRAMAYFEHGPEQTAVDSHPESVDVTDGDRDNVLVENGVLVPCDGGADFCLTDAVRRAWTDAIDAIDADVDTALSESALVDAEPSEFVVDESAGDFAVSVDGAHAGRWPSREAFLADAAGAVALADELPGWHGLSSRTRGIALGELRLFLDRCPTCGGEPDFQHRTEETCCRTRTVTTMRCADCDASFVEVVGA